MPRPLPNHRLPNHRWPHHRWQRHQRALLALTAPCLLLAGAAHAQPSTPGGWEVGAVLDAAASSRTLALGQRDRGVALGHSDLLARGTLGRHLSAQVAVAAHQHAGRLEAELEEAWLQTRSLGAGWQARLGRFSSQIGYLNEQHPHADDFVERPLLYRALLGGHWYDDGLRVNWTAPTPFYLMLGAEALRGKQLVQDAATDRRPGALTLSAKLGSDLGRSHSWQLGAALLHNRREAAVDEHHGDDEDTDGDHAAEAAHDDHGHGARLSGRRLWLVDLAWKWAPDGNNRQQQVRLVAEYARVTGLNRHARAGDRHEALSLAAVWRFAPAWELGWRSDWLRARLPHEDHFDDGRLAEHAAMLAWKPGHAQTLRLQATTQRQAVGFEDPAARQAWQLQYVLSFGAHGAHSF